MITISLVEIMFQYFEIKIMLMDIGQQLLVLVMIFRMEMKIFYLEMVTIYEMMFIIPFL